MGTSLNGLTPQNTYQSLLKVSDNSALDGTLKTLSDGNGNDLPLQASTSALSFTSDTTVNGVRVGRGAGNVSSNLAVGASALNANTTGTNNIGIGSSTASALTTGNGNISIGNNIALTTASIGAVAIGTNLSGSPVFNTVSALSKGTSINGQSGQEAVSIGFGSQSGTNGTAIGYFANSGSSSVAIGTNAKAAASNTVSIGLDAGLSNTSGTGLTAIGYQALRASTGNNNTALGFQAGLNVSTSTNNTTIGASCSSSLTTGSNNTIVGNGGLFNIQTGSANVALGVSTKVGSSGSRNIVLGNDAGGTLISDCIVIGNGATATANNQFVVGSSTSNAGTVTTETITPDRTWTVRINGANYKIPMLAI